jgi:hypothetical protein
VGTAAHRPQRWRLDMVRKGFESRYIHPLSDRTIDSQGALRSARPSATSPKIPPHCRIRQDKVDGGNITLRYKSTLHHVGVGRRHNGKAVLILVANPDIRILTGGGDLIRQLTLDSKRMYQRRGA